MNSAAEDEVFGLYKANSPFGGQECFADYLNEQLRRGESLIEPWLSASIRLDTLILASSVPAPIMLYRATIDPFIEPYVRDGRLCYPAYMSTTTELHRVERHFSSPFRDLTAALLCIDCLDALPGLDMEQRASFGGHESEILLPRAARFDVAEVEETNDPAEIAAITGPLYARSYRALKRYKLRYVAGTDEID